MNDRSRSRSWVIYALLDPLTGDVRYVGKTRKSVDARLRDHLFTARGAGHAHRDNWIRKLLPDGLEPKTKILEAGEGRGWQDRERYWISFYRKNGRLTNQTEGGEGIRGYAHTPETLERISASSQAQARDLTMRAKKSSAMKEKWRDPEYREKMAIIQRNPEYRARISEAQKIRLSAPEARARLSASHKGKKPSAETRAKLSKALKGKRKSPEHRANIVSALKRRGRDPEYRAKLSAAAKLRGSDPEYRAKLSAALSGKTKSREHRAKLSDAANSRWRDPEQRAKLSRAAKVRWQRETSRRTKLGRFAKKPQDPSRK